MSGRLYIVPTPVGNLEDMTFRAVRVLKEVDVILAEDTRTTGVLLKHYDIHTPMQSHHKFNEHETCRRWAERVEAVGRWPLSPMPARPASPTPGSC